MKKYDWQKIQKFYDAGNSWKDIRLEFGVSSQGIAKAVKRGDLATRSPGEAHALSLVKYGPRRMGKMARDKLSKLQSLSNKGGRCKWYEVSGQKLQGKWEFNLANKFNQFGIKWIKLSTGKDVWPYVVDGKLHHYTPDFYLPDYNVYLEVKGHWWGNDKQKMSIVKKQHSDKQIIIIQKDEYNKILNGNFELITKLTKTTIS